MIAPKTADINITNACEIVNSANKNLIVTLMEFCNANIATNNANNKEITNLNVIYYHPLNL